MKRLGIAILTGILVVSCTTNNEIESQPTDSSASVSTEENETRSLATAIEKAPATSAPSVIIADRVQGTARQAGVAGRLSWEQQITTASPYTYDVTNGTISAGDVWRVKNGGPSHWVTASNYEMYSSEKYDRIDDNAFKLVSADPLSTFSIDVDTASYSNVRRYLDGGSLPPADAVRIEELINYFPYHYSPPTNGDPFAVAVDVAECPWELDHRLVRIGVKGQEIDLSDRPDSNLVFLIDVSGSMNYQNKLPLLKESLTMLVNQLSPRDTVSIVVYAGAAGEVLPPTPGSDRVTILSALDSLSAGGSTNGGQGIELAYQRAQENFIEGGVNRVILCTDGDFNVGTSDTGSLTRMVEDRAKDGVFISVLGFGGGNLNDEMMEEITNRGNGNYAYIDNKSEAKKVLVEQMSGTLITIAKDVKIQVEFNPHQVQAYRLVGYSNRMMAHQDFNDDTKDAGEIGAGHTITAFYEVVPHGVEMDLPDPEKLKYQQVVSESNASDELLTVKLRYKAPDADVSDLMEIPVLDRGHRLADADDDFVFAASVASFGMLLRDSEYQGLLTMEGVAELAQNAADDDLRTEFLALVNKANEIRTAQ